MSLLLSVVFLCLVLEDDYFRTFSAFNCSTFDSTAFDVRLADLNISTFTCDEHLIENNLGAVFDIQLFLQ